MWAYAFTPPTTQRKENIKMNIVKENTAFCDTLKIELDTSNINTGYKPDDCMYMRPVAAYLLAISKSADVEIKNQVGKIFKGHNIIDYTHLHDMAEIDHLFKSTAYTALYKACGFKDDHIKADDVTLTLISRDMPQHLFSSLKELGIATEKAGKGIYYIKNMMPFAIQVIVSDEMEEVEQEWLESLIEYVQNDFLPRLMLLGLDSCSKMII